MEQSVYDIIDANCKALKVDLSSAEMAGYVDEHTLSPEQLGAISDLFQYLGRKKYPRVGYLAAGDLWTTNCIDLGSYADASAVANLPMLTEIHAGKNIALIGPPGVGKTHLAEAYGRACCMEGLKAYFLKASELKEKFAVARKYGREANVINNLVKPSCLIIDEIGRCVFDREATSMFFDLIDRRYEKDGSNCMIFTSNKQPNGWQEFFRCDDDLRAALDRLFDNAKVITFKGESYRGRKREVLAVEAGTSVAPGKM